MKSKHQLVIYYRKDKPFKNNKNNKNNKNQKSLDKFLKEC